MESSIFVSAPFKGVFWHFKVDRRILLTLTVFPEKYFCCIMNKQKPILNGREYVKQDKDALKEKIENPILDFS